MSTAEPILPWGQLGVSELSLTYDEDLGRYLMVTLPAFSNKVRPPTLLSPLLFCRVRTVVLASLRPRVLIIPTTLPTLHQVFLWSAEALTGPWTASVVVDVEEFEAAFQQQPVRASFFRRRSSLRVSFRAKGKH